MNVTLTFLGTGTSTGVPTVACPCAVCHSADVHDQRLRPSILLQWEEREQARALLVDTTPDLRTQALRAGLTRLDALVFTHGHADHIMGMDDVRPFNFGRTEALPAYADALTLTDLRRVFAYVFSGAKANSPIPRIDARELDGPFSLFGLPVEPLTVLHGKLPVTAYRFGSVAYVTDFSEIPPAAMERLRDLDLLILAALRHTPHPNHSTLANSLRLAEELGARHALFTHISHELPHAETNAQLPATAQLAYDGQTFRFAV